MSKNIKDRLARAGRSISEYGSHERPFHYPLPIANITQPFLRQALLWLAHHQITIENVAENSDFLPQRRGILAVVPHGEHADHLVYPSREVGIVAAKDYWFANLLLQLLKELIVDSVPVERIKKNRQSMVESIAWQREILEKRNKHVVIYPQGSRYGKPSSMEQLGKQMNKGVAIFARELEVPVYPAVLQYPEDYNPKKKGESAWKRFLQYAKKFQRAPQLPITLRIGEPLDIPLEEDGPQYKEFMRELTVACWGLLQETSDSTSPADSTTR